MEIDKQSLVAAVTAEIEKSLAIAVNAANDAKALATHEQSKPETQYDTVGLEASYLAHGQSQRVAELTLALTQWQKVLQRPIKEEVFITVGHLVQLDDGSDYHWFLLGTAMGGLKLVQNNHTITVITDSSPLGKQLLGKQLFDDVLLPLPGKTIDYEIVSIA